MSDNDMILRGAASERIGDLAHAFDGAGLYDRRNGLRDAIVTIDAIPAAQVTVKPLEWFEVEKYRYGGKYTSEGYTIRYIEGFFILDFAGNGKTVWRFPTIEAAKAAAQADYDARIRSALTVTTHDHAKVQALVDAAEQMLIEYDEVDLDHAEPSSMTAAVTELRAALAAWKEAPK